MMTMKFNTPCPNIQLNNGNYIPQVGMGTMFLQHTDQFQEVVNNAIQAGYRLFDTAALYGNEEQLGLAFRENGIAREELFISSKLKNGHHKYDDALREFDKTIKRLQVDYLDMYLIHYPCPAHGLYTEAWKALEHLYKQGLVKNIGVSNFHKDHLEKVLEIAEIKPAVDQLECNPYLTIVPLRNYLKEQGIAMEAWFPLGGPPLKKPGTYDESVNLKADPRIVSLAEKYGKSPAQILLRWETQEGMIVIPKASSVEHMTQNMQIFDFNLSAEDMDAISAMNYDYHSAPTGDNCNEIWD